MSYSEISVLMLFTLIHIMQMLEMIYEIKKTIYTYRYFISIHFHTVSYRKSLVIIYF